MPRVCACVCVCKKAATDEEEEEGKRAHKYDCIMRNIAEAAETYRSRSTRGHAQQTESSERALQQERESVKREREVYIHCV